MSLWARRDGMRRRLEVPAARLMQRGLRQERSRLLALNAPSVEALHIDPEPWHPVLERVWHGAGGEWWNATIDQIIAEFPEKVDVARIRELRNNPGALRAIARAIERAAARITRESRRLLVREAAAVDRTLQATIEALYDPGRVLTRAQRLAQQEVLDATAILQHEAAIATERVLLKSWLSRGDDRVRPTHAEAHAAYAPESIPGPIPITDYFSVGGASLLHPRDPNGPPGEIANCRCQERFVPEQRIQRRKPLRLEPT